MSRVTQLVHLGAALRSSLSSCVHSLIQQVPIVHQPRAGRCAGLCRWTTLPRSLPRAPAVCRHGTQRGTPGTHWQSPQRRMYLSSTPLRPPVCGKLTVHVDAQMRRNCWQVCDFGYTLHAIDASSLGLWPAPATHLLKATK